ncbi:unnamed protein product [Coregonus sp. 'balchen']|nr:unnamed protein product [Coregonus sp. 'balchen']
MNRYTQLNQLGDGTCGSVLMGKSNESGELVAIKRYSLKKLNHANAVIKENHLYFVFEYMKENLYQLMKDRGMVRCFVLLLLCPFVQRHGFFHRDMKPENLLCMGPELVKIADFGLAREIRSRPPYTDYMSTRLYRAPEVLLRSSNYSSPVDAWLSSTPSDHCSPGTSEWPDGYQLAPAMNSRLPQCMPTYLKTLITNASTEAIAMMKDLLTWERKKRPMAVQLYRHHRQRLDICVLTIAVVMASMMGPWPGSELRKATVRTQSRGSSEPKAELQTSSADSSVQTSQGHHPKHQTPQQPLHQTPQQPLHQPPQQPLQQPDQTSPHISTWPPNSPSTSLTRHLVTNSNTKPSALAGTGSENSAAVELKSGQRRWGQTVLKATDSWDESKEQKTTYSFSTVTKLPSNINMGQMDSSLPGSSARQHYLSQSRYLPGLIGKNSIDKEPSGPTLQDLWEHSTKVNSRPLGAHWSWFIRHQSQRR